MPHPLSTKWKSAKKKYEGDIKAAKLKFDKGLSPKLDDMLAAALKIHQYALDYDKIIKSSTLPKNAQQELLSVLGEMRTLAQKAGGS